MSFEKHLWILRLSVLFMVRNQQVESILTRGPSDVVAVTGSTVVLSCYTNLSLPVYWDTEKAGDNEDNNWYAVYQGNPSIITHQFKKRFNMSVDSTRNQYNLTIHDVQMEDAGTYRCGDTFGTALHAYKRGIPNQGATAELTVIGGNLTCSQNLSVDYTDGSDILPSELINCSLSYEGRIIPTLRWTTEWTNGDGWDQAKHDYVVTQNHPTTDTGSTLKSTMIISSRQRIGKSSLTCAVWTSKGYLTGFYRQTDINSIPYFSSVTRGSVLILGILIGALSFAVIYGMGYTGLTIHIYGIIKMWKSCISCRPDVTPQQSQTGAPQGPLVAVDTRPDQITLEWKPPADLGGEKIERYLLEKRSKGTEVWEKATGHIDPGDTEATVKRLTEGQEYEFRVTAVSDHGKSEPLMTSSAITAKSSFNLPGAPKGPLVAVDTRPDQITLEWKPPADLGGEKIERYLLEKRSKGTEKWEKATGHIDPGDTEATVKKLTEGQEYEFRVIAVSDHGKSEPLMTSSAITAKYTLDIPERPGIPKCVERTVDFITISWDPPVMDIGKPVEEYILEKREPGSRTWTRVTVTPSSMTDFTVKNLNEGEWYKFRVAAVNKAGQGEFSETSEAIEPSPSKSIYWSGSFANSEDGDYDNKDFDDSYLITFATADLHITGMIFYYRQWKWNDKVIGGIRVKYSNGITLLHGGDGGEFYSGESEEFTLENNERIVAVTVGSGCMVDRMTFTTNKRIYGPYGGDGGGGEKTLGNCRFSYLAVLKGKVSSTYGAPGVKNLQFGWMTNRNYADTSQLL